MKIYIGKQEIKYTRLTWSGSKYSAARQLEFSIPSNFLYSISQGNTLLLKEGDTTLFEGFVFRKEKSRQSNEVAILGYDSLIYLLKSDGSFNFKTSTFSTVVRKSCGDVGVPVGSIADGNASIKLEPMINVNLYQIIISACKEVKKKTGKVYQPVIQKGKLNIVIAGSIIKNFELAEGRNLTDSTFSETIENVVNKVIIVDDKGKKIGQVTGDGLSTWGTFQQVYEKEKGKNSTTEAKAMLHGLDREANVEGLGNVSCISGRAITIKDTKTGLKGIFYIEEDTHTVENGNYTMSLQLNFKNILEES
ncbi:hypothetical protein [Bacillus sp. AFS017336]|uniref:XkdQ/YqbQ family protein n=1 Tax=Bacillus sp. AFS017336 TaxID=2033489 RepID=UPI000BEF1F0A|nr:hypothetical protein [Bacillus sp. AFS017336]PEL12663.1 hypothetical protein CN601_06865 [Bacillus sp. AFS017336]